MTEIHLITPEHALWNETISLAEQCSWRAGPFLAEKMKNNEFKGWERVCAACVDRNAAGFCIFVEKDELPEIYTFSPWIGFMFVDEAYRGKRLSELMIHKVSAYARELGYEKIYGSVDQLFVKPL